MKKFSKARRTIQLVSLLLFPITLNYMSPYLIVQGSFEGVLSGSAMLFLGLFFSALFLGRSFCSWICPAGALQDVCAAIEPKATGRKQNAVKYFIFVVWLAAIIAGFINAGGPSRIDVVFMTDGGISVNAPAGYIIYFFVIFLIVILALTLGRRSFCHSTCWMAPFLVLGTLLKEKLRLPARRLIAEPSRCIGCKACAEHCPMSLPVNDMVSDNRLFHTECILCGKCEEVCPKQVLKVSFSTAPGVRIGKSAQA